MIITENKSYPDIFLAGASKSGTTFLFDLISKHPKIQASNPKEPFFHIDAKNPHNQKFRLSFKTDYADFYYPLDDTCLQLDGTSQTIYQTEFLESLKVLSLKPKAIFVLREPASRIMSSFEFTSNNLAAIKGMSFDQYVGYLLSNNKSAIQHYCRNERATFSMQHELEYSIYWNYLINWEDTLGSENIRIYLFEELKEEPDTVLGDALDFLGLGNIEVNYDSLRNNESKAVKNQTLHYVFHKVYEFFGFRFPFKNSLKKVYDSIQQSERPSKEIYMSPLSQLREYFEPYNKKLSASFNLNLERWKQ